MAPRSDEPRRDTSASRRDSSSGRAERATGGGQRDTGGQRGIGAQRGTGGRGGNPDDESGLHGISDARAYTPRGRTVRETHEPARTIRGRPGADGAGDPASGRYRTPRSSRSRDPFRPALQVLDGGRTTARPGRRNPAAGDTSGAGRTVSPRPARATDVAKPASGSRRRASGAGGSGRRPTSAAGRRPTRKPPRPPRLADPHRRLRLGTVLALALFATIGIRLVTLQLVESRAYADGGVGDRIRRVDLLAPRGAIYDRYGAALAHSVEARYVYADPTRVKDAAAAATALSPLLGVPKSKLMQGMAPQKTPDGRPSEFEYLARGVDVEVAKKIEALDLPGIGLDRDERREVPGGDLAANLIGFTGDDMNGLEGIEARYDELLRGVDGQRMFEAGQGNLDTAIPGGYNKVTEAQPGSSIGLTIDRDLQFNTQQILSKMARQKPGSIAAAVILDAHNGEVLAQASHPTYDAADPGKSAANDRADAASSFVVDPGSVHKAITIGAALEEGVIRPDTTIPVRPAGSKGYAVPTIRKGDTTFEDTHSAPGGARMSVPGILAYSSNVGTIKIGDALGKQKLYEYQQKFGLGQATGEGVPGEAAGQLLPPDQWSGSSSGSVPIGHSVAATPLQMAAAYATIANNGTYVQPHLIRETIAPDGKRTPSPAPKTHRVLSPNTAAELRSMMEAVVTVPQATGLKAAIPNYRVAGKTGTGSEVKDGRYADGDVGSFIGMAPADNPRYVIAVFMYAPHGGSSSGDVSAPAFQKMMSFTLTHYRVPPSGTKPPKFVVFPH